MRAENDSVTRGDRRVYGHLNYVGDLCFDLEITERQLAACPAWTPSEEPNPPLSAAAALAKAQGFIGTLPPIDGWWELQNLSLLPIEETKHWFWSARYRRAPSGPSGVPFHLDCWVLMDGSVIQPRITQIDRTQGYS